MNGFRPWGDFAWTLNSGGSGRQWHLLGCLGPELRSIEVLQELHRKGQLSSHNMLCIREQGTPGSVEAEHLINENYAKCTALIGPLQTSEHDLMDLLTRYERHCRLQHRSSVVLDISSMPKRFWFFYLKRLLSDPLAEDLLLTYCEPDHYASGPLSGNHEEWSILLPPFRPDKIEHERAARSRLIVNVGFMPDGLHDHLSGEEHEEQQVHLLIPFPARVSSTQRTWKSAMQMERNWTGDGLHFHRVGADDLSGAFDTILGLLPQNSNMVALAPFGPKPISAAMCIYSCLTGAPVYYSQPEWYSPQYSVGVARNDRGQPAIHAYWIKHRGKPLYALPADRKNLDR